MSTNMHSNKKTDRRTTGKNTGCTNAVGEIIIATIEMRNKFCYPLKMVFFPKLK